MNKIATTSLLTAACVMMAQSLLAQTAAPRTRAGARRMRPVTAYVTVKGQERMVTFVDRTRDAVVFVMGESPAGARQSVPVSEIENIFFNLAVVEWGKLNQAVRGQRWTLAVRHLAPTVNPMLPYLDLPGNNAVEHALSMGDYMMRAASLNLKNARTPKEKEKAEEQYRRAYTVLRHVMRADWSAAGQIADLKSLQCLLALNRPQTARKLLAESNEPMPGDRAYGLYWLIKAELHIEAKEFRFAMDAAVKSLCFENKNIDTFPDALMISARCYEELQEWYRARDVYYEIARIFPNTDWSRAARARLRFIMDKDFTLADEKAAVENVFFGLKEDMNTMVEELLKESDEGLASDEPEEEVQAEPAEDADLRVFD